jgi:L-lactate dehydrogenase complex protein LldG
MLTMSSREKILTRLVQKEFSDVSIPIPIENLGEEKIEMFITTLKRIGGEVICVSNLESLLDTAIELCKGGRRIINTTSSLDFAMTVSLGDNPHELENVSHAILESKLGVAENGAVWLTEDQMTIRVLPFITEHLIILLDSNTIVHTMHQAYTAIQNQPYDFGTFIAGPSKTADIEQSLVIGAHGAKSLTVILKV